MTRPAYVPCPHNNCGADVRVLVNEQGRIVWTPVGCRECKRAYHGDDDFDLKLVEVIEE